MINDAKTEEQLAVALRYEGHGTPAVTAKGDGDLAAEIMALAHAHDVPLHQDRDLVRLLYRLELDEEIPEVLYHSVAVVLAFAYMVQGKVPEREGIRPEVGGE